MSDLIERQAAVDEALTFFIEYLGGAFDEDSQRLLAQKMNALPSAEPVSGEWIPVEQDLPDSDRPVLVTIQWADFDREVTVGEYWDNPTKAAPESEKGWGTYGDHVTAWREMPEPYREVKE